MKSQDNRSNIKKPQKPSMEDLIKEARTEMEKISHTSTLQIVTEGGTIKATIEGDEPYPCIAVQINGMLLGIFEWDKIDKCFRYRIYSEDPFEEEPICKRHFSSKIEEDK